MKWAPDVRKRRRGRNLKRAIRFSLEDRMGTPGETLKGSQTLWEEPLSMEKSVGGQSGCAKTSGSETELSSEGEVKG